MPKFLDIMLVMAKQDLVERAFGCRLAHQPVEAGFAENLLNRANPVGPFGMPRRCQMVEACRMAEKKRHALPWRSDCACEKALI